MGRPRLTFPRRLKKLAQELLSKPENLKFYLDRAEGVSLAAREKMASVWDDFRAMLRLLRAWKRGEYTEVPKKVLLRIVFAVLYFLLIVDVIPDFIPGIGLVDDLTVIGWVLKGIRDDLKNFLSWEKGREHGNP